MKKEKIAVLTSGGVDSSVALKILKDEGRDVAAFYLKIWLQDEFSYLGDCPWEEDLEFVRHVCDDLNVPLQVVPLQNEYWKLVVSYTIDEVKNGRTPNPDIFCNRLIKFGEFIDKIDSDFTNVASGHYATVERSGGDYFLKRSPDKVKDQTYFLSYLNQKQLSRVLFPIGSLTKAEVRAIADNANLANKNRKDSQGICFLGRISFREFIKHHLGTMKGKIIEHDTNKILGEHDGFYFYTIGQRSGLGLSGGPWFVIKKDIKENIIYVSNEINITDKKLNKFRVGNFNWIKKIDDFENLKIKIRHGASEYNCSLKLEDDCGLVTLDKADAGIAPGQFAVFYSGDYCLGGSVILEG